MRKLKKLLEQNNTNEYELCRYTGFKGRTNNLAKVLDGERSITSLNLNLLSAYARGLGVSILDILDEFDIDGTTSQVLGITRLVERLKKIKKENCEYREDLNNGGFIAGINLRRAITDFPLKSDYEFIKPYKSHHDNTPNIALMNDQFNHTKLDKYTTRNKTALNISHHYNSSAQCFFIYSPFEHGGDLKVAISVFDKKEEFQFSEIYGAEWLDREDQKDIVYYKYKTFDDILTPSRINNSKKYLISELEFYKGLYTQITKFKLT